MNHRLALRRVLALCALVALGVPGFGCDRSKSPGTVSETPASSPVRTILLVTVDGIRPDRLGIYGGAVATPALRSFVEGGAIVFRDAVGMTPHARPALAAIFTGEGPDRTDVRDDLFDALGPTIPFLPEAIRRAGWRTAGFVGSSVAGRASGLSRGFEAFDAPEDLAIGPARHYPKPRNPTAMVENLKTWLNGLAPEDRGFAWVHLVNPKYAVFAPPEEEPPYDATIAAIDETFGAILGAVNGAGRSARAMIVFAGTHGVHLGESGRRGDTFWLSSETLSVPLLVKVPDALPPLPAAVESAPVWLPDLASTLARAAGLPWESRDGVDLWKEGATRDRRRLAWTWAPDDQFAWPPRTAVLDAGSWRPLAESDARAARSRARRLDAATRERLVGMGVPLGPPTRPLHVDPPPNADDIVSRLQEVRWFVGDRRERPSLRRSRRLLEEGPPTLGVLVDRLWLVMGSEEASRPVLEPLLSLFPDRPEALHWAGHVWIAKGDAKTGEALIEAAMTVGPADADMLYDLACTRALSGDTHAALARLDEAIAAGYRNWIWIERDPDLASVRSEPRYREILRAHGQ